MKKKRKKNKPRYELFVILCILVVAVIGFIVYLIDQKTPSKTYEDLNAYYSIENENEAAVIVDGTLEEKKAIIQDGQYYLNYEDVLSAVNKRLYYDETENLFCVATPTELHTFEIESLETENDVISVDEALYVSLDFLKNWSDIETQVSEEPSRIAITTKWDYTAKIVNDTECIRAKASIKGNIIHECAQGESLRVVDTDEEVPEGWMKVVTEDGLMGYIRSSYLNDDDTVRANHVSALGEYTSIHLDESPNVAFYQSDNPSTNTTLSDKLANASGLNVVCPTWYFLDGPGEITTNFDQDFVDTCHENGYQVWALINDIDGQVTSSEGTYNAMKATSDRQAIIKTMMDTALEYGVDGINVDLEHVSQDGVYAYLEFIRELSVECRNNGLILSVDTYVPMNYSLYLDREEQGEVADYVIIMCYDEHYSGSEEAGSVSSLDFLENGLNRTLREVSADKIIAAIPFYTRLWETSGDNAPDSTVMGMKAANEYAKANNMEIVWDETVGQNVAELEEDGTLYQIWLEDAESIKAKMEKISEYNVAGVAEWCLGLEDEDVWGVISSYLD